MRADFRGLALDDVARLAKVTRVTVYNQFGSRAGLVEAVFRDSGVRMGVPDTIIAALALPDPRVALAALVRATCKAWGRERAVLQRLVALAAVDPVAGRVLVDFEALRTRDAAVLVGRLRTARQLARGVGPAEATAAIAALTSFSFFAQLAVRDPAQLIERMLSAYLRR